MITLYGASDDLIEIEGSMGHEIYYDEKLNENFLLFSTGHLVSIRYNNHGLWKIIAYNKKEDSNYLQFATEDTTKPDKPYYPEYSDVLQINCNPEYIAVVSECDLKSRGAYNL